MRKEGRVQNFVIALFGIAIVAMSVGFAAYSTTLTIGGGANGTTANATFKKAKWHVHYDNSTIQTTGNSTVAPGQQTLGVDTDDTNVYFTATLKKPGDVYEFTVDVLNEGTYDAELTSVDMSTLTAAQDAYINYTITYDGNTFVADQTASKTVSNQSILEAPSGATPTRETATVRVEYVQPANESQLPTSGDVTVNFGASFVFDEVTE